MMIYGNNHKGYGQFCKEFMKGINEKTDGKGVITDDDRKLFNKQLAQASSRKYASSGHILRPAGSKLSRKLARRNKGFGQKCYI